MIGGRYELQRLRNRMRSRDEQQQRKALVGADGWLFLRNDKNNVLGQHLGQVRLGARRRRAWSRLIERRMRLMRELGVTWLCMIAPDKEAVYPELLPPGMTPAPSRPVYEILAEAERLEAPVFYPLDRLLDAKRHGQPYYQTDTHWNQFGAYSAYLLITDELGERGVEVPAVGADNVRWIAETALGDLGRKLRPHAAVAACGPSCVAHVKACVRQPDREPRPAVGIRVRTTVTDPTASRSGSRTRTISSCSSRSLSGV